MGSTFTNSPHQGLEDRFDGANRRNLRHFIVSSEKGEVTIPAREKAPSIASDNDELEELESVQERYYYLARDKTISDSLQEQAEDDRRELVRIPTCAIFHKFASGKGVPHSFVGFIRQWPALPQVVVSLLLVTVKSLLTRSRKIFMSVCVLPIARIPADQRYDVDKVRSVKGPRFPLCDPYLL